MKEAKEKVIIIGDGVAGLYAFALISSLNTFEVTLISPELGQDLLAKDYRKSTPLMSKRVLEAFGIDTSQLETISFKLGLGKTNAIFRRLVNMVEEGLIDYATNNRILVYDAELLRTQMMAIAQQIAEENENANITKGLVIGLKDDGGKNITGVKVNIGEKQEELNSDLVLDATGRARQLSNRFTNERKGLDSIFSLTTEYFIERFLKKGHRLSELLVQPPSEHDSIEYYYPDKNRIMGGYIQIQKSTLESMGIKPDSLVVNTLPNGLTLMLAPSVEIESSRSNYLFLLEGSPDKYTKLDSYLTKRYPGSKADKTFNKLLFYTEGTIWEKVLSNVSSIDRVVNFTHQASSVKEFQPQITGYQPIGDTLFTANPIFGRGNSNAEKAVALLAKLLAEHTTTQSALDQFRKESAKHFVPQTLEGIVILKLIMVFHHLGLKAKNITSSWQAFYNLFTLEIEKVLLTETSEDSKLE